MSRLRNIPEAKEIINSSPYVIQLNDGETVPFDGKKRPLNLEIGMGKGNFIIGMAINHPEADFIGIERYESVMLRAHQMMEAFDEAPENVRFICMDAAYICDVFPDNNIQKIYLNFSDPWPKARHAKRRLTSKEFLSVYEKVLVNGGTVEFKTDNKDLFDFSLSEIEEAPNWELLYHTYDLHRELKEGEENIMTEYEQKFSLLGNRICKSVSRYHIQKDNKTISA